jgi:DNA-binding NarL/FixJ family response regulator
MKTVAISTVREAGWSQTTVTPREREVLTLIAHGFTSPEIAEALVVSVETVRTHCRNLMATLGARTRAEAVAIGMHDGLIEYP